MGAIVQVNITESRARSTYCTIKVSDTACFRTFDPEVKLPVTVRL
jgi:hypothetical protein